MIYIRSEDFTRIMELLETMKELSAKEKYSIIPAVATNVLGVMEKYISTQEDGFK
ncbi:hypothetical protein ACFLVA_00520 [Chloroflexota bacterium]